MVVPAPFLVSSLSPPMIICKQFARPYHLLFVSVPSVMLRFHVQRQAKLTLNIHGGMPSVHAGNSRVGKMRGPSLASGMQKLTVSPNWTEKRAPSHTSFISSRISDRSVLQHGSRASHASDVRSSPHITSPPGMLSPDVMLVTTKLYGEDTFAAQPTNGNADEAGAGNVLGVGSGLAPGRRSPVGGGGAGEGP
mmetsp:Transcript_41024/g.122464  ORF Transcript_41024/g.122464 Transcript_41024/m.122464 type:complete len:193 (-) Transcript_41024:714-1292(-)